MGLSKADGHSDDTWLESMAWNPREDPVPDTLFRRFAKDVERRKKLRKKGANNSKWRRDGDGGNNGARAAQPGAQSVGPSGGRGDRKSGRPASGGRG